MQNSYPCAGKTMCAESGPFIVVGFAKVACTFFLLHFMISYKFSRNASKRILWENRVALSGKHDSRSRPGLVVENCIFAWSR